MCVKQRRTKHDQVWSNLSMSVKVSFRPIAKFRSVWCLLAKCPTSLATFKRKYNKYRRKRKFSPKYIISYNYKHMTIFFVYL